MCRLHHGRLGTLALLVQINHVHYLSRVHIKGDVVFHTHLVCFNAKDDYARV